MVNIILPLTENISEVKQFLKETKSLDATYYIGIESKNKGIIRAGKLIKIFVYQDGSKKEEMINSLVKKVSTEGKIIIMRKLLKKEELKEFIISNADITICQKKKHNKFCDFFVRVWKRLIELMFGLSLFDGDTSVVAFCQPLSDVLKNLSNASYLSRLNRWKGASVVALPSSSAPAKSEYNKLKNNFMFIGWLALFVSVITGATVYFVLCKATFLLGFVWASAILISLVLFLVSAMIYTLNIKTGSRKFSVAKEEEKK